MLSVGLAAGGLCVLSVGVVAMGVVSICCRDMDEAGSILKDCGELIAQATSTIPRSMKVAGVGLAATENKGGADGEAEAGKETADVQSDSSKVSRNFECLSVGGRVQAVILSVGYQ